jgi:hypothetical protein
VPILTEKNIGIRKKQETNFALLKEAKEKTAYILHGKQPITPTNPKATTKGTKKMDTTCSTHFYCQSQSCIT